MSTTSRPLAGPEADGACSLLRSDEVTCVAPRSSGSNGTTETPKLHPAHRPPANVVQSQPLPAYTRSWISGPRRSSSANSASVRSRFT